MPRELQGIRGPEPFKRSWQDGKLVEFWVEWDNLGLARQIGAAPTEGGVGERIGTAIQRLIARRPRKSPTA